MSQPAVASQSCTTTTTNSSSPKTRRVTFQASTKKAAATATAAASTSTATEASTALWTEKYAPLTAQDLVIPPKKVDQIRSWIQAATTAKASSKLLVLVGSPGIGKSAMVQVLAREMNLSIQEWSESHNNNGHQRSGGTLWSVDQTSPVESFGEFLKQTAVGYQSLNLVAAAGNNSRKRKATRDDTVASSSAGSIIVLDELPNLHGADAQERFREIMAAHILESRVPTILIFSNVLEGRHNPADLEQLVPSTLLYAPHPAAVQIVQIHPATKSRMKKVLTAIAKQEGVALSPQFAQDMHERSGGDLRFAITALQYEHVGSTRDHANNGKPGALKQAPRDTKLSTFHALGKLLYAKRQKGTLQLPAMASGNISNLSQWHDGRPPLDFDPERVVEFSDIEVGGALSFLGYHSPEFFTDVTELSEAFGHFSDAAVFCHERPEDRHSHSIFPGAYAASLAGRAVGNANKHPAPTKFRQFNAPKVFEVLRNRRANGGHVDQLKRRLSIGMGELSYRWTLVPTSNFATDCLPFVRKILPGAANASLDKMHSNFRPAHGQAENQEETVAKLKEQEEILKVDDIADYESDDDILVGATKPVAKLKTAPAPLPVSPTSAAATAPTDDVIVIDD